MVMRLDVDLSLSTDAHAFYSHFRPTLLNIGSLLILTMLKPELNIPGI